MKTRSVKKPALPVGERSPSSLPTGATNGVRVSKTGAERTQQCNARSYKSRVGPRSANVRPRRPGLLVVCFCSRFCFAAKSWSGPREASVSALSFGQRRKVDNNGLESRCTLTRGNSRQTRDPRQGLWRVMGFIEIYLMHPGYFCR